METLPWDSPGQPSLELLEQFAPRRPAPHSLAVPIVLRREDVLKLADRGWVVVHLLVDASHVHEVAMHDPADHFGAPAMPAQRSTHT